MAEDGEKRFPGWIEYVASGLPMGMSVVTDEVVCKVCGGPLNVHQKVTSRICGSPHCQTMLQRGRVTRAGHNIASRDEGRDGPRKLAYRRCGPVAVEASRRAGVEDLSAIAAAVVPFDDHPLKPLEPERRAEFEAHVDAIVAEGFGTDWDARLAEPETEFAARMVDEPDDPFAVGACCIACRGYCCLLGKGTKAFLDARMVAYYRHRNPEATPEEVRAAYLSRLPEVSTEHGCVYQGPEGCTLPREMRADICNSYRCSGQEHMMTALEGRDNPPVTIVALATWHWDPSELTEGENLHRALTIAPDGTWTVHEDIELPPLPAPEPGR